MSGFEMAVAVFIGLVMGFVAGVRVGVKVEARYWGILMQEVVDRSGVLEVRRREDGSIQADETD